MNAHERHARVLDELASDHVGFAYRARRGGAALETVVAACEAGAQALRQPRCATCKYWVPRPDCQYVEVEQTGECTSKTAAWSDCGDYTILTGNEFGCIRWEAKP